MSISEMEVLDRTGHTKVRWSPDDAAEVAAAKAAFDEMTKKGYRAFRDAKKDPRKGERMDTFDPTAKSITLVPQLKGG